MTTTTYHDFTYNYADIIDLNCVLIKDGDRFSVTVSWNSLSAYIKMNTAAPPGMTQFLGELDLQGHNSQISAPSLIGILDLTAMRFFRHCLLNRLQIPKPLKKEQN